MKRSTVLWRFRRGPLRSRSYVVEAWALLALGAATAVGATLAGLAVAGAVEARYAHQRHDRNTVTAVLAEDADVNAAYAASSWTRVRWVLPTGGSRTGLVRVSTALRRGERTRIWLDGSGRPAAEPLSPAESRIRAAVTGAVAGSGICAGGLLGGGITAASLSRRRLAGWETEWARIGPTWDHRTA